MASIERLLHVAAVAALAVVAFAGCAPDSPALPSTADFAAFRVAGDEVEAYVGFDEMRTSADLTARGRVGEPGAIRTVGEPGSEAYLLPFEFEVTDVAAGAGPSTVTVELTLGATDRAQAEAASDAFTKAMVNQEAFVYLRAKKGAGEAGLYRIVNSYGLWMETSDSSLTAPLAEEDPRAKPQWASDLVTIDSLRALAADQSAAA